MSSNIPSPDACQGELIEKLLPGNTLLPEVTVASCTYKGSYALMNDVYAAVVSWMNANGYEPAGPMTNIYHVSPHETQNPDEFVTEVCYPVKKK